MKYATTLGMMAPNHGGEFPYLHTDHLLGSAHVSMPAFSSVRSSLLALDGSRLFNLLEDCRRQYGRTARERAMMALDRWRNGDEIATDGETAHLFTLLAHQLTAPEKLALLQNLRQEWIASLPRDQIRVTVLRGDDLTSVARRLAGSMRRVQATTLPTDLLGLLGWQPATETWAIGTIVLNAETFIAAHRLAAVMMHLATLGRLSALASPQVTVRVHAHLEVPTLAVDLKFQPCFWLDMVTRQSDTREHRLLARLQDIALGQKSLNSSPDFAARVREGLSHGEYSHLRELAAGVGIGTESLLHELQAQTLAARADIQATVTVAERMKAGQMRGRIVSEHAMPCCTAKIEVRNGVCPLAPYASFLSHVSRRV